MTTRQCGEPPVESVTGTTSSSDDDDEEDSSLLLLESESFLPPPCLLRRRRFRRCSSSSTGGQRRVPLNSISLVVVIVGLGIDSHVNEGTGTDDEAAPIFIM